MSSFASRAGLALLATLAAPGPRAAVSEDPLARLAAEAGQGRPLVRIGLDAGPRILVSSDRPFRVLDPVTGTTVWKPSHAGELAVVPDGAAGEVAPLYRVQAGSYASTAAAEAQASRLRALFRERVTVHAVPDRGSWRVRVGGAADRASLGPLMDRMRAVGLEGLWIVDEPAQTATGVTLRLVDSGYASFASRLSRLAVVPERSGVLRVQGKTYRGAIELRVSGYGTVRAIDWVELETYLQGVVPAELGPEVWPQLEALKAQAVAARTYAWRNLGQFEEEGFDLCATPRCQAYEGQAAEHPLSDRAVADTRGEILTWEGRPINALYTATCGGHTEDGARVFPEETGPYLAGVPCRPEDEALAASRVTLTGRGLTPVFDETGDEITRLWTLLGLAGILDPAASPSGEVAPGELRVWTRALARQAGRPEPSGSAGGTRTLGSALAALAEDLGWSERASVLLGPGDAAAILRDPEAGALTTDEGRVAAYLAFTEALRPHPDGSFHLERPASRARLAQAAARIAEAYDAFALVEAVVGERRGEGLTLIRGKEASVLRPAEQPFLFGLAGGRSIAGSRLDLWPGDRVRYRTDPHGRIDFLELRPPVKGASDDRSAVVYSWEVRKSGREVEEAVNRRIAVGRVRDLQVVERGASGRVVALRVAGTERSQVVRGFDVRNLLDLRETLAVIEVQRGEGGDIRSVVFAGKGWGHGVGLCQVGAYGMALRGETYRRILAHYYRGAVVEHVP